MTRRHCTSSQRSPLLIFVVLVLSPRTFFVASYRTVKPRFRTCVSTSLGLSCLRSLGTAPAYRRRRPTSRRSLTVPKCISSPSSPDIGREADSQQEDALTSEDDTFFPWVFSPSRRRDRDEVQTTLEDPEGVVLMGAVDVAKGDIYGRKVSNARSHLSLATGRRLRRMHHSDINRVIALAMEEYCDEDIDIEPPASTSIEYAARIWAAAWELVTSQRGVDERGVDSLLARAEMESLFGYWVKWPLKFILNPNEAKGFVDFVKVVDSAAQASSSSKASRSGNANYDRITWASHVLCIKPSRTEMEWMRTMIRWGFNERLSIGERGEDHSVFCVSDNVRPKGDNQEGSLVALAEVSLKLPNNKTALPIPVPLWLKKLLCWPRAVVPYISNVLVESNARRQGLARVLMARCEEQALKWGYDEVFLHVDIDYTPALRLYESLGYKPVGDDPVVEFHGEPHLRYMRKELRN